jgi:mannitol-1-phosphate/altronate dehydrogenase
VAGCARFLSGTDEKGAKIPVASDIDDVKALEAAATKARSDPREFLSLAGRLDLGESDMEKFGAEFKSRLGRIYDVGMAAALGELLREVK